MEKCDVGSVKLIEKCGRNVKRICDICGTEFIGYTMRSKYCSEDCKKEGHKRLVEKYKENKKENLAIIPKTEQPGDIIFRKADVKTGDVTTVRELAKSLGAVRFQIVEELKKLRTQLGEIEKQKVLLDHQLESHKEVSKKILEENGLERLKLITVRREVKCKIQILDILIREMPENPDKFAYDMISHQEKLDDIYDKKKKWNIAEWNIRGVGRD